MHLSRRSYLIILLSEVRDMLYNQQLSVSWFSANVNSRSCSLCVVARPSVVCLSVTFVCRTQAIEIFGNVSMPFGTLAIC